MTAKTYLSQLYKLEMQIRARQEQIQELKVIASGFKAIDYSADKVQSSPSDRMADMIGRWADMERELSRKVDYYIRRKDRIIEQIYSLDDSKYSRILYSRYVEHKTLHDIADEIPHDYKWLCVLHGRALEAFSDKFLKNTTYHDSK